MPRILNDEGEEVPAGTCQHPSPQMRLRTLSNGTTAIYMQCPACGESTSQAIKKNTLTVTQIHALPSYDEKLRETYQAEHQIDYVKLRAVELADRRARYDAYLQTPAWKTKRDTVMERDNYLCQGCRHAKATEVHHLTYEHIFDELLFELEAVCDDCHRRCHKGWV